LSIVEFRLRGSAVCLIASDAVVSCSELIREGLRDDHFRVMVWE
jgi:hypothetical protein